MRTRARVRACARARKQLEPSDALPLELLRALVDLRRGSPHAELSAARFRELLAAHPKQRAALGDWLDLDADERRQLAL